jgi:hypothetical protein
VAAVRAALEDDTFTAAWAVDRAILLERAFAIAMQIKDGQDTPPGTMVQ